MLYDLIIIGAGPAGITAAIYAARQQLKTLVITDNIGGQAASSGEIENYTGFQFISGVDLAATFEEHIKKYPVEIKVLEPATKITKTENIFTIETEQNKYTSKTVLLTSGKKPKMLEVPGEVEFKHYGVSYCATCDGPLFKGKDVAVIGGGNSAIDAALQLQRIAQKVYVVNINANLNGDNLMLQNLQQKNNVEILNNTNLKAITGDKFVKNITIERNQQLQNISVSAVFIEAGLTPNSDFGLAIKKNNFNEIIIDQRNQTNIPGLFAAGDVTDIPEKQILIAAGEGAKACLGALKYLFKEQTSNLPLDKTAKWECLVCGYIYDPKENNQIAFEDLPADWTCPTCGVGKDQFKRIS